MRSRSLSNNGRTAGISVCITKGTTLKGIRVYLFYINKRIFANQRFDTFWTQIEGKLEANLFLCLMNWATSLEDTWRSWVIPPPFFTHVLYGEKCGEPHDPETLYPGITFGTL
jgi:hypothetical protein